MVDISWSAPTLPVIWIRRGHRRAFAGRAEVAVVPLMGGDRLWEGGRAGERLACLSERICVKITTNFMHLRPLQNGSGLVSRSTHVNVTSVLFCEGKLHESKVKKNNLKKGLMFTGPESSWMSHKKQVRSWVMLLVNASMERHVTPQRQRTNSVMPRITAFPALSCLASPVEPQRVETSSSPQLLSSQSPAWTNDKMCLKAEESP